MSRTEALSYREMCLKFRVKRTEHLLDIIREVESEIESFHAMLDASVIVHELGDVRISEGDQFLLYLRNLPSKVQEFLQVHRNAVTVQQLKTGAQDYYIRTRVQGDLGSVHVAQPVAAKTDLKDKTCFNCGKKGHAPLGVHCGSMRCVVCGVGGWVSFFGHCVRYAGVRTSEIRCTASAAFLLELEHLVFWKMSFLHFSLH